MSMEFLLVVGYLLLGLAVQRWMWWKAEAYRTRDAALDGFRKIEEAVVSKDGCLWCGATHQGVCNVRAAVANRPHP